MQKRSRHARGSAGEHHPDPRRNLHPPPRFAAARGTIGARISMRCPLSVAALLLATSTFAAAPALETPAQAAGRHARVARRRAGIGVICHRGASEFAHENTLEAYRATFELGGDGNEIDVRRTKDGVLVCFHDDTIEGQFHAFGAVSD